MRQSVSFVLFLAIVLLSSCKSDTSVKIGFLYSTPYTERFVKEANYFKKYAEANGAQVIIEHGEGDEAIQYQKAIELFDKDIDALTIIAVNANTAAAIVREAHNRDVKVLAYNRLIKNCELDFFVGGNNDLLGKMMVDEVLKVKSSGSAVILCGDKYDRNAVGLKSAMDKELKSHIESGAIDLKYETFIEDWSGDNAAFELDQYISNTGDIPDIIFSGFDGMSNACIQVLEKHNVQKEVYITGQDATIEGAKNIIAGKQLMTAFHPLEKAANKAAEVMLLMLNDEKKLKDLGLEKTYNGMMDVPTLRIPSIAVTRDNIDKVLIEDSGFYKREDIY